MVARSRRHGLPVTIYPSKSFTDSRGNRQYGPDLDNPIVTRAGSQPQRSQRAEVPGQVEVNVVKLRVADDLTNISIWSRVEWRGSSWDIITPPAYHHGTRHTRHTSFDIRERPAGKGLKEHCIGPE